MESKEIEGIRPETIDLEWLAEYGPNDCIKQNYGQPDERHFGHIDQERLEWFWLVDKSGQKHFGVNVKNQAIYIGEIPFFVEFPREQEGNKVPGKLVYFRRVRNDFTPDKGVITTVRYAIGLQANVDGHNYQQYLFINMDGTFTLSQKK